tara:strand:+ start:347 stop:760 length:414 start_codon:yes stop_codon:yes gene_type:complete
MQKLQGYVTVRNFNGFALPVPIQNKLLRYFCSENNFIYLLPQCEMVQEDNFCYLFSTINSLKKNSNIGMCSIKMLPNDKKKFDELFNKIVDKNITCHFIFENISANSEELKYHYFQSNLHGQLGIRSKNIFQDIFNL